MRHLMLSYYYVQEALASGDYVYLFVHGKYNQFVVLCTHWKLRGAYQEPARHVNIVSSDRHLRRVRIRFRNSSSYLSAVSVSTQDGEQIVSTQDGEQIVRQKGHNDRGVTKEYALGPKHPNKWNPNYRRYLYVERGGIRNTGQYHGCGHLVPILCGDGQGYKHWTKQEYKQISFSPFKGGFHGLLELHKMRGKHFGPSHLRLIWKLWSTTRLGNESWRPKPSR